MATDTGRTPPLPDAADAALFSDVFEQLPDGAVIYAPEAGGADFRIAGLNAAACRMSRVTRSAAAGRRLTEVFPGAAAMGFLAALQRVHRSGEAEQLPPLHYADNEREGWFRNHLTRLPSGHLLATYRDVSDEVAARRQLAESETRYALLTESMAEGIFDWDIANDRLYLSPRWKAQLGYEDRELPNSLSTWENLLHCDDRAVVLSRLQAFLAGDAHLWDEEFRLVDRGGRPRWIRARATAVRDASGEVQRLLGVHMDIDTEKADQAQLERERALVNGLCNAIPDLFFLLDRDGRILACHLGDQAFDYLDPDSLQGRLLAEVLPGEAGFGFAGAVEEARISEQLVCFDFALHDSSGERHFEARLRRFGDRHRISVIVRNVTERVYMERDLRDRLTELTALYRVQHTAQATRDGSRLLRHLAATTADSLGNLGDVAVAITVDGETVTIGDARGGRAFVAMVNDGKTTRGQLLVRISRNSSSPQETQRFANGAAQVLGLWLANDEAQKRLRVFERIVQSTRDQVALIDADLRYQVVNDAYARMVGQRAADIVGRRVDEVLDPTHVDDVLKPHMERVLRGDVAAFEEWRTTSRGPRFLSVLYTPYFDAGNITGFVVSAHDITKLHRAESKLLRAARVFSSTAEAIVMMTRRGIITDVNAAFTTITGFDEQVCIGADISMIDSGRHSDAFVERVRQALRSEGGWHGEMWARRRNGVNFPILATVSPVLDSDGTLDGYVAVFSDISALKENEQRLELLANHDPLTGLANRHLFEQTLQRAVENAASTGEPFALLFVDLDHFKTINDTHGHGVGDAVLRCCAERMAPLMRSNDLLARIGGDEFVVLCQTLDSEAAAVAVAGKLLEALGEPMPVAVPEIELSASVGIARYPEDGRDWESLLRSADGAMYRVKQSGRGSYLEAGGRALPEPG